MSDIDKAIEIVQDSQHTHKQWLKWIMLNEECGCIDSDEVQKILRTAGGREHQEGHIESYQFVIDTLESLR